MSGPNGNGKHWRPRWWVALTTISTFVVGMGIGLLESQASNPNPSVFGFATMLIGLGVGAGFLEYMRR